MNRLRHVLVAGVALAFLVCGRVQAQVLEQIPDGALVVLKFKDLSAISGKVAKLSKAWGLDQMNPDLADPLASLTQKAKMSQGLNKSGDMAIAFFDASKMNSKPDEAMVVLVPTDDYDAFLKNFGEPKADGDITQAKSPEGNKDVFITHWGAYAAVSPSKKLLGEKPKGLKLEGLAAKEAETKDMIAYANMPLIRETALPKLKEQRPKIIDEITKNMSNDESAKKFIPVAKVLVNEYLDGVEQFLNDSQSGVFGVNLSDEGISTTAAAEFTPDSKFGKFAAGLKGADAPTLAGLPLRKYFAFGGFAVNPKTVSEALTNLIDPISKELAGSNDAGKALADMLEAAKTAAEKVSSGSAAYAVPNGALGQESIAQTIAVMHGDAAGLADAEKLAMKDLGAFLKALPPDAKAAGSMDINVKPEPKVVDGVSLTEYEAKIQGDPNDPKSAQMQQMMAMIYGPNGPGGVWGAVNDKTFLIASGAPDKLLSEAIAAAKENKDVLSDGENVKMVTAQLPKERNIVYYIALDNIVTSAVRYAQGFGMPVQVKLPANLPPIGVTGGGDGATLRMDTFIPSQLVQSLIAAGIDAYTKMQNGGANHGANGGL